MHEELSLLQLAVIMACDGNVDRFQKEVIASTGCTFKEAYEALGTLVSLELVTVLPYDHRRGPCMSRTTAGNEAIHNAMTRVTSMKARDLLAEMS